MPDGFVSPSQFQLTPDIGGQLARGLQIGTGLQQFRLGQQKLAAQERQTQLQPQIQELRGQAIGGNQGALTQLAQISPEAATQVQTFQKQQLQTLDAREKNRLQSVVEGAVRAQNLPDDASRLNFLEQRRDTLIEQGLPTQDTDEVIALFEDGKSQEANDLINAAVESGRALGFLEVTPSDIKEREIKVKEQTLAQRKTEQEFKEQQAVAEEKKLSATVQKILDTAQTESIDADTRSRSLNVLADDISKLNIGGGLAASTSETLKNALGTQDDVSELRRRFNAVRASQAVQNLPPGPASDKDIQLALSGFPPENASGDQVESFLRGAAKLESVNAAFHAFKSDLISKQGSTKGLIQGWREKVPSEKLGRDIQVSELFITAQNRGLTVDEVKQRLGIQ